MSALLSLQDLMEMTPSAFATAPISKASDKYKMVTTSDIITGMMDSGWSPVHAAELRTTSLTKKGHQYHVIKMENKKFDMGKNERFQIIISNGADTVTPLSIQAGIFRLVCSNGLVAGRNFIPPIKLSHVGSINQVVNDTMEQLPMLLEKVQSSVLTMKSAPITDTQFFELAQKAFLLRHDEIKDESSVRDLMKVRRKLDESSDLWTRFNVIQENLLNGTYHYPVNKSNKTVALYKSTAVQSVKKDIIINQALFDHALTLVS